MSTLFIRLFLLGLLLIGWTASGADPLFESNEFLSVTLTGPFEQLNKERDKSKRYSGLITYEIEGEQVSHNLEMEVRGNNRLKKTVCKFPPIRLRFKKKAVADSLFDKQRKLKLVTQCNQFTNWYGDYVLSEYLAYRILNVLTDDSYRVRPLRIKYVDPVGKIWEGENFAFLIEANRRLAKRLELEKLEIESTTADELQSRHLNIVSLFQLMIGNVDWSATNVQEGDCCHNVKLFGLEGKDTLAIPYDFDLTGLVNAEYAIPNADMKLRTVRERRYRGYCPNNDLLDENIELFNARKEEIISLVQNFDATSKRNRKRMVNYIESFYRIINDPDRVESVIHGYCHKSYFVET